MVFKVTKKLFGEHVESDGEGDCIFVDEIRDSLPLEVRDKLTTKENQCIEIRITGTESHLMSQLRGDKIYSISLDKILVYTYSSEKLIIEKDALGHPHHKILPEDLTLQKEYGPLKGVARGIWSFAVGFDDLVFIWYLTGEGQIYSLENNETLCSGDFGECKYPRNLLKLGDKILFHNYRKPECPGDDFVLQFELVGVGEIHELISEENFPEAVKILKVMEKNNVEFPDSMFERDPLSFIRTFSPRKFDFVKTCFPKVKIDDFWILTQFVKTHKLDKRIVVESIQRFKVEEIIATANFTHREILADLFVDFPVEMCKFVGSNMEMLLENLFAEDFENHVRITNTLTKALIQK